MFEKIRSIFHNSEDYLELQIIYIVGYYFVIGFFIQAFYNAFMPNIFLYSLDFLMSLFFAYASIRVFIRTIAVLWKKGPESLLIFCFFKNFNMKYYTMYLEAFLIGLIFFIMLLYASFGLNSLGIIIALIICFRIYLSVILNLLGKILLDKKVSAMNRGENESFHIEDKTFKEIFLLIDQLKENVESNLIEKVKAERFKTELITNISHDLKTPLTSIINYIDLLKAEKDKSERERYVQILEYNANRLKSLIIDLVDASKTGTGNIEIQPYRIELNELINQVYGQFDERFHEKELDFIFESNQENIYMFIDGDQLSRVFENLFSNISKYGMYGTRVYVKTVLNEKYIEISMKNTSELALNIEADELMSQFVRGDKTRHSEGNGLGLYIVHNIVQLLGGLFYIDISADLFTAMIRFNIQREEKEQP